jgi:hypothetical protein
MNISRNRRWSRAYWGRWSLLLTIIFALLSGTLWAISADCQWDAMIQTKAGAASRVVDKLNWQAAFFNFWAAIFSALTAFAGLIQKMFEEGVTFR